MQVVYSNYCNVTPIDSNFQIYSLTDYDFLSLIHSNSSRQICPYFSEHVSLRMDVCVPGVEMSSGPDHATFYMNLDKSSCTSALCL